MESNINNLFNPIDLVGTVDIKCREIYSTIKQNNLLGEYEEIQSNAQHSGDKLLKIIRDGDNNPLLENIRKLLGGSRVDVKTNSGINWLVICNLFECLKDGDIIKIYHKINNNSIGLAKTIMGIETTYFSNLSEDNLDENGFYVFSDCCTEDGDYLVNCDEQLTTASNYSLIVFGDRGRFNKYMELYERLVVNQYIWSVENNSGQIDLLHAPIIAKLVVNVLGKKYYTLVTPKILVNDNNILDNYVDKILEDKDSVDILKKTFGVDIYNLLGWAFLDSGMGRFTVNNRNFEGRGADILYKENIMIPVICDISLSQVDKQAKYKGVIRKWENI